jgi:hypothetical protein
VTTKLNSGTAVGVRVGSNVSVGDKVYRGECPAVAVGDKCSIVLVGGAHALINKTTAAAIRIVLLIIQFWDNTINFLLEAASYGSSSSQLAPPSDVRYSLRGSHP